jgi:hypothetical protein
MVVGWANRPHTCLQPRQRIPESSVRDKDTEADMSDSQTLPLDWITWNSVELRSYGDGDGFVLRIPYTSICVKSCSDSDSDRTDTALLSVDTSLSPPWLPGLENIELKTASHRWQETAS